MLYHIKKEVVNWRRNPERGVELKDKDKGSTICEKEMPDVILAVVQVL